MVCFFVFTTRFCIIKNVTIYDKSNGKRTKDYKVKCNYCGIVVSRNKKHMAAHANRCGSIPKNKLYVFIF